MIRRRKRSAQADDWTGGINTHGLAALPPVLLDNSGVTPARDQERNTAKLQLQGDEFMEEIPPRRSIDGLSESGVSREEIRESPKHSMVLGEVSSGDPRIEGVREVTWGNYRDGWSSGDPRIEGVREASPRSHQKRRSSGDPRIEGVREATSKKKTRSAFPDDTVLRRYTFKLYPTRRQDEVMRRQCVLLARLWNAALEQREMQWARECQAKHGGWKEGSGSARVTWQKSERRGLTLYDQYRELKDVRAADPEYAAMSVGSMRGCLNALDEAFKAFYRRLKELADPHVYERRRADAIAKQRPLKNGLMPPPPTRWDIAGYPRYKSSAAHTTIWHLEYGSGVKLTPAGKHWRVYSKGIPGTIKARGCFPASPLSLRSMEIIHRDGHWWASVAVYMAPRRKLSTLPCAATVRFDLIDEFARVEIRANGRYQSGWEGGILPPDERNVPENSGDYRDRGAVTPDLGAGGNLFLGRGAAAFGAVTPDLGAGGNVRRTGTLCRGGAVTPDLGAGGNLCLALDPERRGAVTPDLGAGDNNEHKQTYLAEKSLKETLSHQAEDDLKAARDKRFKKFSCRWKRETLRIAKIKAKAARSRRDALHRWSNKLTSDFTSIEVISPEIKESTRSAKGNAAAPGAAVGPVAALNRHVLSQAPALAMQMIEYKAAEAGIPFARVTPGEHKIAIGRDLPATAKAARRAARTIKKELENV